MPQAITGMLAVSGSQLPINAIKAGYMIGIGQETAEIGRKFTNRRMRRGDCFTCE